MLKLCVFDLDGTLCDTIHDVTKGINYGLEQTGLSPHPESDYISYLSTGGLVRCAIGEKLYTKELRDRVQEAYMAYYFDHMADTTRPFPGIAELIGTLRNRGILCGVLTNKKDINAKKLIGIVFPDNFFCFVVGNSKIYPSKPDPTSLNVLLSAYGISKEECVMIGDSRVDMETAHATGVKCIGAGWGYERETMLTAAPDFVAENTEELKTILMNWEKQ